MDDAAPHLTQERKQALFDRLCNELQGEQIGDVETALIAICGWTVANAKPTAPMTRDEAMEAFFQAVRYATKHYVDQRISEAGHAATQALSRA